MPSLSVRRLILASVVAVAASGLAVPHTAPPPLIRTAATTVGKRDRPSIAELDRRITVAARRLEAIVEQYNDSRDDLRANLARQRTLGSQIGPMARDLERRQALVGDMADQTYRRTVNGPGVALFGSADPHQFIGKLLFLHELATDQQHAVDDLRTLRRQVTDTRTVLTALAARQRRTQMQLAARRTMVEGQIAALKQMRNVAYGGGSRYDKVFDFPAPPDLSGAAGQVVAFAFAQLGKPYSWGADGPGAYDCSGLTLAAWRRAGVSLPHNAARQYGATARLDRSQARPGDLVFFYNRISHVGVYIGNGMMIHAPEYGERVRIAPVDSQPIHGFGRPGNS